MVIHAVCANCKIQCRQYATAVDYPYLVIQPNYAHNDIHRSLGIRPGACTSARFLAGPLFTVFAYFGLRNASCKLADEGEPD